MSRTRSLRLVLLCLLAAGALALPLRADIEPGIFVMWTSPLVPVHFQTYLSPGLFGLGSDEVVLQDVYLHGVPLVTQGTPSLEPGDTIIELQDRVDFPTNQPAQKTVNARVVAINLTSSVPVTVTYNGGTNSELWDMQVCLSTTAAPASHISFINQCESAGTFMAALTIQPRLIFTRSDRRVVSDPGLLTFQTQGYWMNRSFSSADFFEVGGGAVIDPSCNGTFGTTISVGTTDAILGLQRVNCNTLFPTQGYQQIQPIYLTEHYALEPATRDERTFLLNGSVSAAPGTHRQAALQLGFFALLAASAVVIRPRRRP